MENGTIRTPATVILFVHLLCTALALPAQENPAPAGKGASPVPSTAHQPPSGVTRAVVVGISDYRDERITDLQFAHRDAEEFAAWLHSSAGGGVPSEQVMLLINEQATTGKMVAAFDWLISKSKPGDRAIIYFSGHGDVETVTRSQRGFLLTYDSPANVYSAGAYALIFLQDVIETLSLDKETQVIMISDACRAGKLAGSETGGTQKTATALTQQFAKEIKILSCQPEELSLEGPEWGGGRGCFSYHLTEGLTGLADQNQDMSVELREIGRYLEDKVSKATAPHRQMPMMVGSAYTPIARVDEPALQALLKRKAQESPGLLTIKSKGLEDLLLANADSSVQALYQSFVAAVEKGELLQPAGHSANDYFERLMLAPGIEDLQGLVKRNFAAALQDEAQIAVNKLLRTDPAIADDAFPGRVRYAHLPAYLQRAGEILGQGHYLYRYLKAKQYFFEAKTYTKAQYPGLSLDSLFRLSDAALDTALAYDSEAAYVHLEKGLNYYWKPHDFFHASQSFKKALELSPSWVLALYYYGYSIAALTGFHSAVPYMKAAIQYDSMFLPAYERLGYFDIPENSAYWRNEYVRRMQKWMEQDSNSIPAVYYRYLGLTLHNLNRNEEAEKYLLKGAEMSNWEDSRYYKQLGMLYTALRQCGKAREVYKKYTALAPHDIDMLNNYLGVNCPMVLSPDIIGLLHKIHYEKKEFAGAACPLYRYYCLGHNFFQSKKIGQEHNAYTITDQELHTEDWTFATHGLWYYGSPERAESMLKARVGEIEATGSDSARAALKSTFGAYGQLVIVNLAQGDVEEAEYWFEKRDKMDAFQNQNLLDGWGYGLTTWVAYARGRYEEADSIMAGYASRLDVGDLIEDALLIVSIADQVDYAIFSLEKTVPRFLDHAPLHYHLARLYLEQKNDYAKGVPLLERAVQLESGFAVAHYHLGAAYAHLGKNDAALEHLENALKNGYEDWEELAQDVRWARLRGRAGYEQVVGRYRKE